jgi:hypothetical protein
MRRNNLNISGPPTSPPGPSALSSHTHEWEPVPSAPIIEDGAAIFREECRWAETKSVDMGRHGSEEVVVGAECDEFRTYRFELAWIKQKRANAPGIYYLASELDRFPLKAEAALIEVEQGAGKIKNIDPDEDWGIVIVEGDNYEVCFKADPEPQKDPHR